jgi:hypothetical protein
MALHEQSQVLAIIERIDGKTFVIKGGPKPEAGRLTPEQKKLVGNAKSFLEYRYPEIKDLAKQFLVVIAGVLTLSLAFSEKVFPLESSSARVRILIVAIWVICFVAFALGGAAIFFRVQRGHRGKVYSRPRGDV